MSVHTFYWQGIDSSGMRVEGFMSASGIKALYLELAKKNIVPVKVCKNRSKKISGKDITDFSRQLATMINSGIPLLAAFNIIEKSYEHVGMRNLIAAVKQDIEAGLTLTSALKKHSRYFDDLFCNLVYAGEQSGALDKMLNHVADYKEKLAVLKRKIKKAMFYPVIVLLMAVIVTAVLLVFVVPQFSQLFQGFGAALPLYTQFIINLSNAIKTNWFYVVIVIFIGTISFRLLRKFSGRFVFVVDRIILKTPIFGKVIKQAIMARLSRTLAITFTAGLPLSDALQIIAGVAGNSIYQQAIINVREYVIAGRTIASAIEKSALFPNRVVQMIHIGEESGALDIMLVKIAEYYESEVNHVIDNLSNLLEPMIMAILGVLIGGLIIGMYLPIFKLGTVI